MKILETGFRKSESIVKIQLSKRTMKKHIWIRKLIRRSVVLSSVVTVVLIELNKNDKKWEKLDEILKWFLDMEEDNGADEE
ncbi:hypothetical protein DW022_16555 [Ruminococcus sp. AF37-6AT]|nr:hypothetical protein DW098_15410 [Ruminococcus sp. AM07-21]RHL43152.1 hypothetical protein DW022_16555 [Ruminococcus sp. AF37-6AT]